MDIAVLGIKNLPAVAGADRVVEKLLENYSPANDYWVYIRQDTPEAATCSGNLHFVHVPALKGKHLGSFSFFLMCCVHYLLKGRYDLAHVHNSDFGLFVPLLRLRPGVRVLGTFHGDPYTRAKWGRLARAYLKFSERCFVQFCHALTSVSRFRSEGAGLWSRRDIRYIPNGVDPYWSLPAPEGFSVQSLGVEASGYVLFACGRLDSTKGLHTLLDAWARLETGLKLLVVGDFGHDPAYSRRVNAVIDSREDVVAYRGLLGREELLEVVRQCRLFVFPSEYEAMSMMLLEVISCKRPVVVSDIPENTEVLVDGYPWVFAVGDPEQLAGRLAAALAAPDIDEWTARLFERCMRDFSWPTIAGQYEELFRELGPGPSGAAATA